MRSVYLAGPEVFLTDAMEIGRMKKEICRRHGLLGLFPFDNEAVAVEGGPALDVIIYRGNVAMMRQADFGVFNLTPFRGPGADGGTCFELGFMTALGKPCVGYSNDGASYIERVRLAGPLTQADDGCWRDAVGLLVEDFDNADNLMLDCSIEEGGRQIFRRPSSNTPALSDLSAFEACVAALAGT